MTLKNIGHYPEIINEAVVRLQVILSEQRPARQAGVAATQGAYLAGTLLLIVQ